MKTKLALAGLMLSLTTISYSATTQTTNATIKCPDISELKAAKFTEANSVYDTNLWAVGQPTAQNDIKDGWRFTVNIEADDKVGALKNATTALNAMHLINGPEKVDNAWMCHYRSGQHDAVAILNIPDNTNAVASVKSKALKKQPA